tara:strand:+ start:315 stop:587 length:273 start_codon:yes stop_codon:yes gene_type:complete
VHDGRNRGRSLIDENEEKRSVQDVAGTRRAEKRSGLDGILKKRNLNKWASLCESEEDEDNKEELGGKEKEEEKDYCLGFDHDEGKYEVVE